MRKAVNVAIYKDNTFVFRLNLENYFMITEQIPSTIKSVFISRKLMENSPFLALKNKMTIVDESLIQITQIRFSYTPQTQWIFFSSKNAITHFFAQNPELPEGVYYAVTSQVSADYLLTYGKIANFTGKGTDTVKIAKDFRDALGDDSVLFPQAIDSLQTIQKQLAFTNTCYNLYVYKTTIKSDFTIPHTDVVIFTSPSNVIAYFNNYKIDDQQIVIAMGQVTKKKLSEYGIINVLTPTSFNETGLCDIILRYESIHQTV